CEKRKNPPPTRHITLVPPGEWKDNPAEDEEGDAEGGETEAQQDAPVETVREEAPAVIDLAALDAREQKLARFLQLNANHIKNFPNLADTFKEAANKTV